MFDVQVMRRYITHFARNKWLIKSTNKLHYHNSNWLRFCIILWLLCRYVMFTSKEWNCNESNGVESERFYRCCTLFRRSFVSDAALLTFYACSKYINLYIVFCGLLCVACLDLQSCCRTSQIHANMQCLSTTYLVRLI